MRTHTHALLSLLLAATLLAAGAACASTGSGTETVVHRGTVAALNLPYSLTLDDGTIVRLPLDTAPLLEGDPRAPRVGDSIVVTGRGGAADGALTVHSAGIRISRPSGRVLPTSAEICPSASASIPLAFSGLDPVARPTSAGGISAASARHREDEAEGTIVSLSANSFLLRTMHSGDITVLVQADTELRGVTGLDALVPGDQVRAKGQLSGQQLTASLVELMSHDGGGSDEVEGAVVSVGANSFLLRTMHSGDVTVLVQADTELQGFTGLDALVPGDQVRAEGQLSGQQLTASLVELMSHDDGGNGGGDDEVEGAVVSVDTNSFLLRTMHSGDITVLVQADTELRGFTSLDALVPGDQVRAKGQLSGQQLTASLVELMSHGGGGGAGVRMESIGVVTSLVPPDGFVLNDGRTYSVSSATVYEPPLASYGDLQEGQYLEVKAMYRGARFLVTRVELEGDGAQGQGYRELQGTVSATGPTGFAIDGGQWILVMPTTVFDGDADTLGDVEIGWHVEVRALFNVHGDLLALRVRADDPAPATTTGEDFEPQEALVVLQDAASPAQVAQRYGAVVSGTAGNLGYLFRFPGEIDDQLLASMNEDPEILAVEPNYLLRDPESSRKRFPVVDRSGDLTKLGQQAAVSEIDLAPALAQSQGAGIVIAIMDTGVDPCHPALAGHLLAGGMDVIDGDMEPWETRDGIDEDGDGLIDEAAGHGSFVASLIALAAPAAKILPYRVLDDDGGGTAYGLALALADAIDRGAQVINLSLTYDTRSSVVDLLLERAAARGIVVVASAGNDPAAPLPFPATDSHVLAVTALASGGAALASFANRSAGVPLAAPGEQVYGALDAGLYGTSSGSSMAAPFAAAGAALILATNPQLDPALVMDTLVQAGKPLTDGQWSGAAADLGATLSLVAP